MLLTESREWPWGLVFCGDPDDRDALPTELDGARVAATRGTIVAVIQHAVDGEATATVAAGAAPHDLTLIYTADLTVTSGRLLLTDAGGEQKKECELACGEYRVKVYSDGSANPAKIHFALNEMR